MAKPEHVAALKLVGPQFQDWRKRHVEPLDVSDADSENCSIGGNPPSEFLDLTQANFKGAKLFNCYFGFCNFARGEFDGSQLFSSSFQTCRLEGVNARASQIVAVHFERCDFGNFNLSKSQMYGGIFQFCNLTSIKGVASEFYGTGFVASEFASVDFTDAKIGGCYFVDCNLNEITGLSSVQQLAQNSVDISTMSKSLAAAGNHLSAALESFLIGAGVQKRALHGMVKGILEVNFNTAFVSYGSPDQSFAEELVKALRGRGVSCWLYSLDNIPGRRTWAEITEQRREAGKMIIICSAKSLQRPGVLKEIEEQIDDNPDKLIPFSLDEDWKKSTFEVKHDGRDLKPFLLERNHVDFGSMSFEKGLEKLLQGLRL